VKSDASDFFVPVPVSMTGDTSEEADRSSRGTPPIVFFDGVCNLCNGFVDFLLTVDPDGDIRFGSLQGEAAQAWLDEQPDDETAWSVVYVDEEGIYTESEATLRILQRVGGTWAMLGVLRWIPRWIRDPVYRWVARHRYTIFGKKDRCRVPTPEEEERFLT